MTRLKTCGAVERPKQRAKNWKTLPNAMNWRKYPEYGCIGKSRYTSFRMMYLAHKARNLILAATTASTSWYKQNGCNSRAKKEEPDRRLPFGAETAPSGPRRLSGWCGGKKPPRSRLAPQQEEKDGRMRKKDESARGATRGEMYLLVPPCGLLLTAAQRQLVRWGRYQRIILNTDNRSWQ